MYKDKNGVRHKDEKDGWLEWASIMPTSCRYCSRLIERGRFPYPDEPTMDTIPESKCEAFPDGIPVSIYFGHFDHSRFYYDNERLRFKPIAPVKLDGKMYSVGWLGYLTLVE